MVATNGHSDPGLSLTISIVAAPDAPIGVAVNLFIITAILFSAA